MVVVNVGSYGPRRIIRARFWPKKCFEQTEATGTQRCEQHKPRFKPLRASRLHSCEALSETIHGSSCRSIGLGRGIAIATTNAHAPEMGIGLVAVGGLLLMTIIM
jgi:hypothetical protein